MRVRLRLPAGVHSSTRALCACQAAFAGLPAEQQGDILNVLRPCRQQRLFPHLGQAAHPAVTMSVQLLGVGEAALHGFFPALIDALAPAAPVGSRE